MTVWQSQAQLDEIYGHHADTALTNHRTKLIFPSGLSDMSTARYIIHLIGDEHAGAEIEDRSLAGCPPDAPVLQPRQQHPIPTASHPP